MKICKYIAVTAALVLLVYPQCGKAQQPTNMLQQPDCVRYVSFTAAGSVAYLDNRQAGCNTWAFYYTTQAMIGVSLQVESAPSSTSGAPGTAALFTGTNLTGTNPTTSIFSGAWTGAGYVPWIRVTATVITAFGGLPEVRGILYGWKMRGASPGGSGGSGSGGGCGGGCGLNPNAIRYHANITTVLAGAAEKVTIQSSATATQAVFESADVYCSAACNVTISQNGTAATTTAFAIVGVNGASTTGAPIAYSSSNVGTGTILGTYTVPAGATLSLDMTEFIIPANAGTAANLSIGTDSITGTARIQIRWRKDQ